MIRFSPVATPRELPDLLARITLLAPWPIWRKRVESLGLLRGSGKLWDPYLADRHGIEFALVYARDYLRKTGRWPWPPKTAEEYRLASFLATTMRVYDRLSSSARKRLAGSIVSALEKECGLESLAHEMKIVTQLLHQGFALEFSDLESGGGFDFLATQGGSILEVECKHMSADVGRQIYQRKLYALGSALAPILSTKIADGAASLLRVSLPARLTGSRDQEQEIVAMVSAALDGNVGVERGQYSVTIEGFELEATPFCSDRSATLSFAEAGDFARERFNLTDAHMLIRWKPGTGAMIVHLASRKPDLVVEKMFKKLRDDADRQFTGQHPAALCVHLSDLTSEQLSQLAQSQRPGSATAIQIAASDLITRRPHVHSLAFLANGTVNKSSIGVGLGQSIQEQGLVYAFPNSSHPSFGDATLDIFCRSLVW